MEGVKDFEENIFSKAYKTYEQGSIVSLPYIPLIGKEYLEMAEHDGRKICVERMISSFPKRQVLFSEKDVSEWPFMKESMYNPSMAARMKSICDHDEQKVLGPLYKKYADAMTASGCAPAGDGFIVQNDMDCIEKKYFIGRTIRKGAAFFGRNILSARNMFLACSYAAVQIPEAVLNKFYIFPLFKEKDGMLLYDGPSMKEYVESRKYLRPLRNLQSTIRYRLAEIK